jgi:hypothetical protein
MDENEILFISTISIVGTIVMCCFGLFLKEVFFYQRTNINQLQTTLINQQEIA